MTLPDLISRAQRLAQGFALTAPEDDASGELRHANFAALHAEGLLALTQPASAGGHGLGLEAAQAIVREIARGCPSTALVLAMHYNNIALAARGYGWPEHLRQRLFAANLEGVALINSVQVDEGLGSPSHGFRPSTIARRTPEGWRISGHKKYATGSTSLEFATIRALIEDPEAQAEPQVALFFVPLASEGVRIEKVWNTMGLRASASHDVILDEVLVPLEDIIGLQPLAAPANQEPLGGVWFFTLIAATYAGVARAAADWANDFAASFHPGGREKPLSSEPRVLDLLGEIGVKISTNRLLLDSLSRAADAGRVSPPDASAVRHQVIENAVAASLIALDLGGNQALWRANAAERHHRDALAGRAHAPNNAALRGIVARPYLAEAEARLRAKATPQAAAAE